MDLSAFYAQFREEVSENIRVLNDGLLALEDQASRDHTNVRAHLDAIFRAMHTIKGSARLLGFEPIAQLAHAMEHMLDMIRAGKQTLDRELANLLLRNGDILLQWTDRLINGQAIDENIAELIATLQQYDAQSQASPDTSMVESLPSPTEQLASQPQDDAPLSTASETPSELQEYTPAPATPVEQPSTPLLRSSSGRQTIRVRVDRLDRLLNLVGELAVTQQMLAINTQALSDLNILAQHCEQSLLALDADLQRLRFSPSQRQILNRHINDLLSGSQEMRHMLSNQCEHFEQQVNQYHFLVNDLEQEVMATRLLPISTIFSNLPRAVRDLAHATEKVVELELQGETTELDRKMIEALNDPLLHLIRNAVDHGIESPDQREAMGKPRSGRVRVSAEALGNEVCISIQDDGQGMDPRKICAIALRKGLISAEQAERLSYQEALELILLPGFSSASIITDISGRGVGMDVVHTNISELGGKVVIVSQSGQGTTISLQLPLTLITTQVILVRVSNATFAIPTTDCQGMIWVHRDSVCMIEGHTTIEYEGRIVPLLQLSRILGIVTEPFFQHDERMPAIILSTARVRQHAFVALLVDHMLDEREAVVKSLGPLLEDLCYDQPAIRPYGGAIQFGDGALILLLNPAALIQAAHSVSASPRIDFAQQQRRYHLLVVEDSFTTRELLRSIMQSAGYTVTTAVDGRDALDKLRTQAYDLVMSDIEMPHMDGFELTESIRYDLQLDHLPIIIMTSLASDDYRRRGLEVGAQAYIIKSQFNQDNLLEIVQQLLGSTINSTSTFEC